MGPSASTELEGAWTPTDFIVGGRYCENEQLRRVVGKLRKAAGAESALLLVSFPRKETDRASGAGQSFFRSLLIFAHESRDAERTMQDRLFGPLDEKNRIELPKIEGQCALQELLAQLPPSPFSVLRDHYAPETRLLLLRSAPGRTRRETASCLVALFHPAPADDQSLRVLLNELTVMVHASVPIVVHRSLELVKNLDHLLRVEEQSMLEETRRRLAEDARPVFPGGKSGLFAEPIVRAAVRLTGSTSGALYLATQESRQLALAAQFRNDNPIGIVSLNEKVPTSVYDHVYRFRRPLIINTLRDFEHRNPHIKRLEAGGRTVTAQLVVPILQHIGDDSESSVLGVLSVERDESNPSPFGADDLFLLRALAQHFCIRHSQETIASAYERLPSVSSPPFMTSFQKSASLLDQIVNPNATPEGWHARIPIEYCLAKSQIESCLAMARELTRTTVATVRFLSHGGHFVTRFCSIPRDADQDEGESTDIHAVNSINAWVLRTEEECYLPDILNKACYPPSGGLDRPTSVRSRIRSMYCIPLFISGRAIGSLHVESEYRNAYLSFRPLLRWIASQIEAAIARAYQVAEQRVLWMNAQTRINTHELLKCVGELKRLGDNSQGEVKRDLIAVGEKIQRCLGAKDTPEPCDTDAPSILREWITRIVEERVMGSFVEWRTNLKTAESYLIPGHVKQAFRLAFVEVLENSLLSLSSAPTPLLSFRIRSRRRGAYEYLNFAIRHPLRDCLDDLEIARIYRVPIVKPDRTHLGAFLAGTALRSVGGDMWMTVEEDRRTAVTVLEVPRMRLK